MFKAGDKVEVIDGFNAGAKGKVYCKLRVAPGHPLEGSYEVRIGRHLYILAAESLRTA